MDVQNVSLDRTAAAVKYREYKKHLHYSTPMDDEIRRTYQRIAQGKTVIKAIDSIVKAGLNEQKLPKLAIARADQTRCFFRGSHDGSGLMADPDARRSSWGSSTWENQNRVFRFAPGSMPGASTRWDCEAIVPTIPVNLRPRRGLQNYHILFEAEWSRIIPADPMLLRRMGKSDLWLVVAAWDLTEIERTVLASRL